MSNVFAVANQKGGVAKTTTVHALGTALSSLGDRVLLVDLDPQACLTYSMGVDPDALERSIHDCFVRGVAAADVLTKAGDLVLLPASIDLAGSELFLLGRTGREFALRDVLAPIKDGYDFVLIDCAPSLGVLTIAALTAADAVLIPMQCEALSERGVRQLIETIDDVRRYTNPNLRVAGIIATMFDGRTVSARRVLDEVAVKTGLTVLDPPVRRSVRFAEAPATGRSLVDHAPKHPGAEAYRRLAEQLR
jgi:chromosome partitioning protein